MRQLHALRVASGARGVAEEWAVVLSTLRERLGVLLARLDHRLEVVQFDALSLAGIDLGC